MGAFDDQLPDHLIDIAHVPAVREPACEPPVCRRLLLTLLFTDIVGSTRASERLGDEAWLELLQRHHAVVRALVSALAGHEVDCCGDGFFAVFGSPASAIRCAGHIRDALARCGLQVRAGLHAGECCFDGARVAGIAVHVAARIVALAQPMEVLVSDTLRDLVAGSGLGFTDRGRHVLKGLSRRRALYAYCAGDVAAAAEDAAALPPPSAIAVGEIPAAIGSPVAARPRSPVAQPELALVEGHGRASRRHVGGDDDAPDQSTIAAATRSFIARR